MVHIQIKRYLVRKYPRFSKYIPDRYYPYRFAGGRIFLNIRESQMMFERSLGLYETEKMEVVSAYLKPGMTFVDVGANKGDFTLVAAKRVGSFGRVVSFEPEPSNCYWLRRSIGKNGYSNIELIEAAAGETDGEAVLYLGEKSGWHSLRPHPLLCEGTTKVSQIRLDSLSESGRIGKIDMIKVDVEGAEIEVLRGGWRTLSSNPDIVLLMDIHPQRGVDPRRVVALLADMRYDIYEMKIPHRRICHVEDNLREVMAVHRDNARLAGELCAS